MAFLGGRSGLAALSVIGARDTIRVIPLLSTNAETCLRTPPLGSMVANRMAIRFQRLPNGAFAMECQCGARAVVAHPSQFQHQCRVPTHYGAGDLIAKATSAVGIKPCAPCEKRKAMMNNLFPKVWKR